MLEKKEKFFALLFNFRNEVQESYFALGIQEVTAIGHLSAKSLGCVVFPVAVTRVLFRSRGRAGKKHENVK